MGLLGGAAARAEGVKDPYDDAVTGTVRSELTGAPVVSLDGTYSGCAGRSGSWSIRGSGASALSHTPLSVVNGDSACILTVTHVNANEQFTAVPPIPLSTAYAVLKDGLIGGSTYVVEGGALGATSTYAQIASAYDGAISKQKTITGPNPTIPAADFGILTLSVLGSIQVRNVIVKRSVSGIAAYQVIRVTFIS